MIDRTPEPITCTVCNQTKTCTPCSFDTARVDFKTRTGVCKVCAALPVKGFDVFTHEQDTLPLIETIRKYATGNILEIGCNEGYTTALLGTTFADKTIYGIDYAELPEIAPEQSYEIPDASRIGIHAKDLPNVKVLLQDSTKLNYTDFNDVGAVFIDGDHSYAGVKADTEKALGYFSERGSGLIVWHDAYADAPEWCGVWRYLQELKAIGLDIQFIPRTWIAYLRVGTQFDSGYLNLKEELEAWYTGDNITAFIHHDYAKHKHVLRSFSDSHNMAIQTLAGNKVMFQKSLTPAKYGQIAIWSNCEGIGDMICALYAVAGIVEAGFEVFFYAKHLAFLSRAWSPNVHILDGDNLPIPENAVDIGMRYHEQTVQTDVHRKQWYCDNFKLARGIDFEITPVVPDMDLEITEPHSKHDYVVIAPVSEDAGRNWDNDKWKRVANELYERNINIVAIGRPVQKESLESTFGLFPHVTFRIGDTAENIANLMLQSRGFIGIDSGMTHFAALLGVNSVAVSTMFPASLLWSMTNVRGYRADATADEIVEALL